MKKYIILTLLILLEYGLSLKAEAKTITTKSSCKKFIDLESDQQPKFIYWIEGFGPDGFVKYEVLDFEYDENLVPIILKNELSYPNINH